MIPYAPFAAQLDALPLRRETVAVAGGSTALWVYGPDDADTTIVMVHGFRGDHHGLEPIVAQLPGYRLVLPDLPGFGISTPLQAGHDVPAYSAWLRELVTQVTPVTQKTPDAAGDGGAARDAAHPHRLVVLGHSFGSIIVSAALADGLAPDAAVLVNPIAAPALSGPRGILTRLAVFYYRVGAWLPERAGFAWLRSAVVTRFISITMAKTKNPLLRQWIHDQHRQFFGAFENRAVVLEAFEASVSNDVSEFAARIHTPTLLIAAANDDITPVAAQHRLVEQIPDAELVVLPNVGHLVHYEMPREAASAIETFLLARDGRQHPEPAGGTT